MALSLRFGPTSYQESRYTFITRYPGGLIVNADAFTNPPTTSEHWRRFVRGTWDAMLYVDLARRSGISPRIGRFISESVPNFSSERSFSTY